MNDEWGETLTLYLQRLLPLLFSLLLLLVSYVPFNLPVSNNIRPAAGMICVYFWLLYRPDVFNLLSVYFLGLTEDIISSAPFGSNIFALLVMYVLVTNLSRFSISYIFLSSNLFFQIAENLYRMPFLQFFSHSF